MNHFSDKIHPKYLFLIDGLGALISAFMLGVPLVYFEQHFGMPRNILYGLAFIPCVFAAYSLFCYWRLPANWRPYLRGIAILNLLYCGLTATCMVLMYSKLTVWGLAYFCGEIVIVVALAWVELKRTVHPK